MAIMDPSYADGYEDGKKDAQTFPNEEAFAEVCADLDNGHALTLAHVGKVFGPDFWIMIVLAFMDANDAARAIQGAINRLAGKVDENS